MPDFSWMHPSPPFWDKQGVPIITGRWFYLANDYSYRLVCLTQVGRFDVSTVWHGLNTVNDLPPGGRPDVFKTRIFALDGTGQRRLCDDLDRRHYAELAAARTGHGKVVAAVQTVSAAEDTMDELLQ